MRDLADPQPPDAALLLESLEHGAEEWKVAASVGLQLDIRELVQNSGDGSPHLGSSLVQSSETGLRRSRMLRSEGCYCRVKHL